MLTGDDILKIREVIKEIPISDAVMDFALSIVVGTHPESEDAGDTVKKYVATGVSPRAAQAIIKSSKARAFMEGRFNVSYEDVKYVAYPALRHRIITNFEAIADGISTDYIIGEIIRNIEGK